MQSPIPRPAARLSCGGELLRIADIEAAFGPDVHRLPVVLRLLLENLLRHVQGDEQAAALAALREWLARGSSEAEIAFQPGRVLMHDTTSTPALVDIAALRDAVAEAGRDPELLNPVLPVDVSVDHSLAVEAFGRPDAAVLNMGHEIRRNAERYRFLKWAAASLRNVTVHAPGTGIMHTMNLEQLATVVQVQEREGERWAVPDTLLGTDSHTPMVNGIGVLGWGVGGLEAQTVMFGLPTLLRLPEVVGVRLAGALPAGVTATDLALVVTQRLRAADVTGAFVEFFGPGVATLSAGERSVVANMAPEYGATTGFFPVDAATLRYLRDTGRSEAAVQRVEAYCRRNALWFDPQAQPRYSRTLDVDLAAVGLHVAGPRRPQDLHALGDTAAVLRREDFRPAPGAPLPRHPVALAAIASCTNTSDPALLVAAGLVARKARRLGLRPPAWVKTSLSPGSPAAAAYLERAGLLQDLAALGFDIVGHGCATCIGNPGPLPEAVRQAQAAGQVRAVAILSGNRNFPGRVHPDLDLSFILSPPLVVAFALAGDAERDLQREPVAWQADGRPVPLQALWPQRAEIEAVLAQAAAPQDYRREFLAAERNPQWLALDAPAAPRFPWQGASTALRRPPFADRDQGSLLGRYTAWPLLVLGDDVTTDHISPASAIPPDSAVADHLVERGDSREDLNVFASRRGNWEVMVRAAFHSRTLANRLAPGAPVAHTLHQPSGRVLPLWEAAQAYRAAGDPVVLVAGERYGMGSSRDWAAKGQRLLGIRAVLAASYERIHRSNLVGMGILPLQLPPGLHPDTLRLGPGDRLEIDAREVAPRARIPVRLLRAEGAVVAFEAEAAVETRMEAELLRYGGVMPAILRKTLVPC